MRKTSRTLGLELGQTELCLVSGQVERRINLTPGTVQPANLPSVGTLLPVLQEALASLPRGVRSRPVAVSLPMMSCHLDTLELGDIPGEYPKVLRSLLLANDDVSVKPHSHAYSASYHRRIDGNVQALMGGLHLEVVRAVEALVRRAGLKLSHLDTPITAHLAQLSPERIGAGFVWLHLEANGSQMLAYSRSSGRLLLRALTDLDSVLQRAQDSRYEGYAAAQELWARLEHLDEDSTLGLSELIIRTVQAIEELGQELNYSIEDPTSPTVEQVIISGAALHNPTLVAALREQLSPTYRLEIVRESVAQALAQGGSGAFSINLFGRELRRSMETRRLAPWGYVALAGTLGLGLVSAAAQRLEASRIETETQRLRARLSTMAPYVAHLKSVEARSSHIQALQGRARALEAEVIPWERYLAAITTAFPPNEEVKLSRLELSLGSATDPERYQNKAPAVVASLSGAAQSKAALERWLSRFEGGAIFGVALERYEYSNNSFGALLGVATLSPEPPLPDPSGQPIARPVSGAQAGGSP